MTLESPPLASPFKDRKTGLLVFGIFEILLGAFFVLSLLSLVLSLFILARTPEHAQAADWRSLLPGVLMMGGLAVSFVWLGIGSIKARRWARALSLCLGWIGLIGGVFSCLALIWTLPGTEAVMRQSAQQQGQQMPSAFMTVVKVFMVFFAIVFYILIPGALVLFYRSRHVKLTCEERDPVTRWTDRCPLPVLAMVLLQAFGAASMLMMLPLYGQAFPFFGGILKGLPATTIYLGFAGVSIYVARGFYRLQIKAFWIYFVVVAIFMLNGIITFSGGGLMEFYQAIDLPKAQLKQIEQMPLMHSQVFPLIGAAGGSLYLGFLLWLKRFFVPAAGK